MHETQEKYTFSVVIPAHNEERYIGSCLQAIRRASKEVPGHGVQMIVVANRCTDRTEEIARWCGAEVVQDDTKCISSVRNAGARAAKGRILVTIDADSRMSEGALQEILELIDSGDYIGGGSPFRFERMSLGILCSGLYVGLNLLPIMKRNGGMLSGAMFWCRKADFDCIGGFDESLVSLEDMDFASRLKAHGARQGKRYGTLKRSYIVTSSRKFDEFGDWYLIRNRKLTKEIFTGKNRKAADQFYYNVR